VLGFMPCCGPTPSLTALRILPQTGPPWQSLPGAATIRLRYVHGLTRYLLVFGMSVKSFNMGWFKDHVFIAAWCSPILTLVGIIIRNTVNPTESVNWSLIVLYVVCLTCLAADLTPGLEANVRSSSALVGSVALFTIVSDVFFRHRKR
jgi:hypothetical protein